MLHRSVSAEVAGTLGDETLHSVGQEVVTKGLEQAHQLPPLLVQVRCDFAQLLDSPFHLVQVVEGRPLRTAGRRDRHAGLHRKLAGKRHVGPKRPKGKVLTKPIWPAPGPACRLTPSSRHSLRSDLHADKVRSGGYCLPPGAGRARDGARTPSCPGYLPDGAGLSPGASHCAVGL